MQNVLKMRVQKKKKSKSWNNLSEEEKSRFIHNLYIYLYIIVFKNKISYIFYY